MKKKETTDFKKIERLATIGYRLNLVVLGLVLSLGVLMLCSRCLGQEGCGRWVTDLIFMYADDRDYGMVEFPCLKEKFPDSVWVPGECPEDSLSWKANEGFILLDPKVLFLPIMMSAVDSLIEFAAYDIHYQERYQTWRGEEEEKEQRCQEVWECVREKLIEFLEERNR